MTHPAVIAKARMDALMEFQRDVAEGRVPFAWYRAFADGLPFIYRARIYFAWVCGVNPPGKKDA